MVKRLDSYVTHLESGRRHIKMEGHHRTYCGELLQPEGDWRFEDKVHSAGLASCQTCRDGWLDRNGRLNEK